MLLKCVKEYIRNLRIFAIRFKAKNSTIPVLTNLSVIVAPHPDDEVFGHPYRQDE